MRSRARAIFYSALRAFPYWRVDDRRHSDKGRSQNPAHRRDATDLVSHQSDIDPARSPIKEQASPLPAKEEHNVTGWSRRNAPWNISQATLRRTGTGHPDP